MEATVKTVSGNIVDVMSTELYPGTITIAGGTIAAITRDREEYDTFILPGFVDSHVHIESSMLPPSEFARAAVVHGTVAAVSDPHEIANVMGADGVAYMIHDGTTVPMKFCFGAPSCVPATGFETSGAVLNAEAVKTLLERDDITYLAEMMNFPGVIHNDPEVMEKIRHARDCGKPIDGHAPGLRGDDLQRYKDAGISTNHECLSRDEVVENIRAGMKVQLRKGSAADIFDTCIDLIDQYPDSLMLCSDDKHPDDLVRGYLNDMVRIAVARGIDIFNILKVASVNPVVHYGLDVGLLRRGDPADFLVVDNLIDFTILKTYIDGQIVARTGTTMIPRQQPAAINRFAALSKEPSGFSVLYTTDNLPVIVAVDGQLVTERIAVAPTVEHGHIVSDVARDILKIAVVNRYQDTKPAIGFIKNFGLREGAIASSVAHDCHNIVAVGVRDDDLCTAVNRIIQEKGGICAVSGGNQAVLPLPIAGIMSTDDYHAVARKYTELDGMAKSMGSRLRAPFMTLSFMALPVIPKLKMTDRGLFDAEAFEYV